MSRLRLQITLVGVLLVALGLGSYAAAGGDNGQLRSDQLTGYEENPDISSTGRGTFTVRIEDGGRRLRFDLRYSRLEAAAQQAHIHFGKRAVNGGVSAFLCGGAPPASDKAACPASGRVTGTIDPADIIGPEGQGIEPGSFRELVAAMRVGRTYVNVHTTRWPGGEIRAQINRRQDDD